MYKTAECVTRSHPDKVCDQISDAILDACLAQDEHTRAAVEVMGGHGTIIISGELTTNANIDMEAIAKNIYKACGYDDDIKVIVNISEQSHEIQSGVDNDGAGDQGIMIGYATNETPELLPKEFVIARTLTRLMGDRDGKAQVTIDAKGALVSVITSVANGNQEIKDVILESLKKFFDDSSEQEIIDRWHSNPNGEWTIGGFEADTGLTGRKIVVDAYGPRVAVGGGAFSGKDATKVDRSGAYMARRIAVDLLKEKNAKEVKVELTYAIGLPEPLSAHALVDGEYVEISGYDLRPQAIIKTLGLRKPVFLRTAEKGHFGNGNTWD